MPVRLICFDLDGTLIDSLNDIATSMNEVLAEHGAPAAPIEAVRASIGEGPTRLLEKLLPEVVDPDAKKFLVTRFLERYDRNMLNTTAVYDGAEPFIEDWLGRGGRIGLITNKLESPTRRLFAHLRLDRFPWVGVYGADTWPERKPSPLPLRKMMEAAGTAPRETLMIGDGTPDLLSANAAGVGAIALEFGYTDPSVLRAHGPLSTLRKYADLPALIASLP